MEHDYERPKREKFFLNVYGRSYWQFDPARPSGYCEPFISATMSVIILKPKRKYVHFYKLQFINFSKYSTKPSEFDIYSNREIF